MLGVGREAYISPPNCRVDKSDELGGNRNPSSQSDLHCSTEEGGLRACACMCPIQVCMRKCGLVASATGMQPRSWPRANAAQANEGSVGRFSFPCPRVSSWLL